MAALLEEDEYRDALLPLNLTIARIRTWAGLFARFGNMTEQMPVSWSQNH
ncbi:hypothetical protein ACEWPL_018395 [Roseovarius sp. S1116L3]